jgi:hypothetical protein
MRECLGEAGFEAYCIWFFFPCFIDGGSSREGVIIKVKVIMRLFIFKVPLLTAEVGYCKVIDSDPTLTNRSDLIICHDFL